MRRIGLVLCALAAGCAYSGVREPYEKMLEEIRAHPAHVAPPEGSAAELRERYWHEGRLVLPEKEGPDLSKGADVPTVVPAALERNAELVSAVARWEEAVEKVRELAHWEDPELQVSSLVGLSGRMAGLREIETMLMQMIPFPGVLEQRVAGALANARAAGREVSELGNRIRAEAVGELAELYALDRALEINRANRELLRTLEGSVNVMYQANRVTQQDLLRVQLRGQQLVLEELALRSRRQATAARLNELVGGHPPDPVGPARVPEPQSPPELAVALSRSRQIRPDLAAAAERALAAIASVGLAELGYYPNLTLGAEPERQRPKGERPFWMLDLVFGFPLKFVNWEKYSALERQARAAFAATLGDFSAVRRRVEREVTAAHAAASEATLAWEIVSTQSLPTARQTYEAARAAYEAGQVDLEAVLMAQMQMQEFEEQLHRRHADSVRTLEELRRAVGKSFEEVP